MSYRNPWYANFCLWHSYWSLSDRNSLTRSRKSMMTNPRNDHQPLPAPYQPAYHCSVWHRLPPVLYGHHHHSLCSTRRLTHSVGGMWLLQLLKLYAHAAPSPRSCIVPLISPSMEKNSRNFSKDGLCWLVYRHTCFLCPPLHPHWKLDL